MFHTLLVLGWMGVRRCYLDVPLEEALLRFAKEEGIGTDQVKVFEFQQEFCADDCWE